MSSLEENGALVLIIDDEEALRSAGRQALVREGYEVYTAANGQEGVEMARELQPDVVLVDLNMPGLAGMAVLEELAQAAPKAGTLVITAYATVSTAVGALTSGADDFLAKPFTPDELRLATARCLNFGRQRVQYNQRLRSRFGPLLEAARKDTLNLQILLSRGGEPKELAARAEKVLEALEEAAGLLND